MIMLYTPGERTMGSPFGIYLQEESYMAVPLWIYIIIEKLAEYQDDLYVFPQSRQGKPVYAYVDKHIADRVCFLFNWQWLLDNADPEKNTCPQYEHFFRDMFYPEAYLCLQHYGLADIDLIAFSKERTAKIPYAIRQYIVIHSIAPFSVVECQLFL